MHFITIAAQNLHRRPLRSSLTALGVAMAVGCVLAMTGISRSLDHGWVNTFMARGTHLLAVRKDSAEMFTGAIREDVGDQLAAVEGVRSVSGELMELESMADDTTMLAGGWKTGGRLWTSLQLNEGRIPAEGERGVALVGEAAVDSLKTGLGRTVKIQDKPFAVIGIFKQSGSMGNSMLLLPLADLQDVMGMQGRVAIFNLQVDNPGDSARVADIRARLKTRFPELAFWETKDISEKSEVLRLLRAISWGVSTMAAIIGCLVLLNTLLMSVAERTREIGVLSALGWSPRRILGLIVLEGFLLSAAGGLLGIALGFAGLRGMSFNPNLVGFLDTSIPLPVMLQTLGLALGLGALASLYPAWRALRLNVVEALRYE